MKDNKKEASLIIVSNQPHSSDIVENILSHYFPKIGDGCIEVKTKYYTACVKINHAPWPSLLSILGQHSVGEVNEIFDLPPKEEDKEDLLIMLAAPHESFPAELYDLIIHKYNPDNLLLIVDTKVKTAKWSDEQKIKSEVNNFIEVVKQDLQVLRQDLPKRIKSGLLQQYNQDWSVLNLIELIQTNQWSTFQRVPSNSALNCKQEEAEQAKGKQKEQRKPSEEEDPEEEKPSKEEGEEEMSEEQLELQMKQFQAVMFEMMSMKNAGGQGQPVSHELRKKTAENLIQKLLQGSTI